MHTRRSDGRQFGAPFVLVVAAALAYFLGIGILAPVVPRYVEDVLGGGGAQVGLAVGAFALAAALLRPWIGRVGDRRGRRVLVVGGCAVAAASVLGYGVGGGLAVLVVMRLFTGAGEAAAFVGAATAAQDLAAPERRGQAASFFSIAIYSGLAIGPPVGEWVYRNHGDDAAWLAAAACCAVGGLIGLGMPKVPGRDTAVVGIEEGRRRYLHPAALRPGVVLALGASGYAGFSSFVPLYVDEIGLDGAGPAFVLYAALVLSVRILGSRLPDVLGPRRGPLLALGLQTVGLVTMGVWASATGLYVATAVYASGVSLLYPALFPAVVDAAPEAERSHAIATFTLFFDLAMGLGAPLLGAIVAVTGERGAFIGAGILSFTGWWLHRSAPRPRPRPPRSRIATA